MTGLIQKASVPTHLKSVICNHAYSLRKHKWINKRQWVEADLLPSSVGQSEITDQQLIVSEPVNLLWFHIKWSWSSGREGENVKNIPATVAPGFHLLEEDLLLFPVRPRRKKKSEEKIKHRIPLSIYIICKKEHDLQPVNTHSRDLCLSKDFLYNSLVLFLPLFSLTVISGVAYKFQYKLLSPYIVFLHSKIEGFPNYS